MALLLTGCAAKDHVCPKPVLSSIEKTDTVLIKHLEKENHLLRVEIDHLKNKIKELKKLVEIQQKSIEMKKSLQEIKKEIK